MEWLNYHHLLYFWTVAREGSVVRAAEELRLSQPTVSGQVRALEQALGEQLFARSGRRLVLTDVGRVVYRYADEIFSLGRELMDTLHDRPTGRPARLMVGVADALSKLIAYRLIEPALTGAQKVRVVCREGPPDRLAAELAVHALDLVLADGPVPPGVRVRAFNHLLGECGVTFFATAPEARRLRRRFPESLNGTPMLLPGEPTTLRRSLEQWLSARKLRVQVAGEFDDSALMSVFGQAGAGVFAAPSAIEAEVRRQFGVSIVGRTDAIRERFYAITVERRIENPAAALICERARSGLFVDGATGRRPTAGGRGRSLSATVDG